MATFPTRGRLALTLPLLVLLLAACGGGPSGASAGTTSTTTAGGGSLDAFRACLKEHGVDLPDGAGQGPGGSIPDGAGQRPRGSIPEGGFPEGGFPEGGQPPAGFGGGAQQEAFQACQDKAPAGVGGGGARNGEALQAYTSCLKDHGVAVPDAPTEGQATRPTFDRNDPNFTAANETCKALLPTPGSTTTTVG